MTRFSYRPFRPAGRFRAQSWLGTGEPTKPVTPPKPLPVYSGRHSDTTEVVSLRTWCFCPLNRAEAYELLMDYGARQAELATERAGERG